MKQAASKPTDAGSLLGDGTLMASYQCDCGNPAKFFKLETGMHQCEQCTLNQIYSEEQNDDVYAKVLQKMRNIMAVRQKVLKKKLKQVQRHGRHSNEALDPEDSQKREEQIQSADEQPRVREAATVRCEQDESKVQAASLARKLRQEHAMTQQVNLMYDLLHIEIEKMRRRSMQLIQARFTQMQQQQLLDQDKE